jgi:hypothetical protein
VQNDQPLRARKAALRHVLPQNLRTHCGPALVARRLAPSMGLPHCSHRGGAILVLTASRSALRRASVLRLRSLFDGLAGVAGPAHQRAAIGQHLPAANLAANIHVLHAPFSLTADAMSRDFARHGGKRYERQATS